MDVNKELILYIEKNIFPKYEKYYSHGMIHINNVIKNMLMLADYYNLDKNIAYVIAAFHDIGLNIDRDNHEYESGKILSEDKELKKYFSEEEIKVMNKLSKIIEVLEKKNREIFLKNVCLIRIETLISSY